MLFTAKMDIISHPMQMMIVRYGLTIRMVVHSGNTENNSIVLYDGTDIKKIKTGIGYIISAKSGKISDDVYIAYTVDSDGDFGTFDDIQLYVIDTKGGEPMLVDEGCIEILNLLRINTAHYYGQMMNGYVIRKSQNLRVS